MLNLSLGVYKLRTGFGFCRIISGRPMMAYLSQSFESYILVELGLSRATLEAYNRDVSEFLLFAKNYELTTQLLEDFIKYLRRNNLKDTTIRRKCMSIRCWYKYLISLGKINPTILDCVNPVSVEKGEVNVIKSDGVRSLLSLCGGFNIRRDVAILSILYHSGLRVSELCQLNITDVNLNQRTMRIKGKGCQQRIVPISKECVKIIQDYLSSKKLSTTDALFIDKNNSRITRRAVTDMITRLSRRAGIKHTTAHTLRKSCATTLLSNGMELELVQNLLGHKDLSTTQHYLSVDLERLKKVHKQCHPLGAGYEIQC